MAEWTGVSFDLRNNDSLDRYNTEFLPPTNKVTVGSWRGARAAESASLLMRCGATHRGFKSLPLRQRCPARDCCEMVADR